LGQNPKLKFENKGHESPMNSLVKRMQARR
jgi:hypothetical protein